MEIKRRKTDRFRPDRGLGGTLDGLSLPQQDEKSEAAAVQKHQAALAATHVSIEACADTRTHARKVRKGSAQGILEGQQTLTTSESCNALQCNVRSSFREDLPFNVFKTREISVE